MHNLTDRALKERVIGAVVLVVFAVLVVPVFLDGQSGEQAVNSVPVTLPGQDDPGRETQIIVLKRDRNQPVPANSAPSQPPLQEARREPEAKAAAGSPMPTPPVTESKAAPVTADGAAQSATGMWAVQLGSFSSTENAERLAADLRKQGFAAFLSELETDAGALQRVRIGPQKDRASAEAIAAQLQRAGHQGRVVPHP